MFEIIDDKGVIYSSNNEEEMINLFERIKSGEVNLDWEGDLKLILVIDVFK